MEAILYLCHRIPYPPNKGDKIRSFNLLKKLAEHYEVHLGCFVDDEYDWQYTDALDEFCASHKCIKLNPKIAKFKGARALLSKDQPITVPYYASSELQRWVDTSIAQHNISKVLCFSSSVAQFVSGARYQSLVRVMDFVDMDSDKWQQYAKKKSGLAHWVYAREARTLAACEQQIAHEFDASCFVSDAEADLFKSYLPVAQQAKVCGLYNGVDSVFFNPDRSPAKSGEVSTTGKDYLVFTGAMDYWANEDAVVWFVDEVWPQLLANAPDYEFLIVGGNPSPRVKQLAQHQGVTVTGRVEDIRPYINNARAVVAPLRIARGIQNKVLEALAMNRPIIATSMAMEGIIEGTDIPGTQLSVTVADDTHSFAAACLQAIKNTDAKPCQNRAWVTDHFGWDATLARLPELLSAKASQ